MNHRQNFWEANQELREQDRRPGLGHKLVNLTLAFACGFIFAMLIWGL